MQDKLYYGKLMHSRMLRDSQRGPPERVEGNYPRLITPALVSHLINRAISTRKVTTAMYFQDKLAEWVLYPSLIAK
jgi:hypothetical protein